MTVKVITDSSANLPFAVAEKLGITIVDLHVMGDQAASADAAAAQAAGAADADAKAASADAEISTAGLSALELAAVYARQLERGGDDGVVALHVSQQLSSTYSAATQAAAVFDDTVEVVETGTVGMAMGAAAIAAARVAKQGGDLAACAQRARETLEHSSTWVYLNRIEDLRRSGRLSAGTAMLSAALLAAKPIMAVRGGKIELAGKTRTQSKAFAKLAQMVSVPAEGAPVLIAIQHNAAAQGAEQLKGALAETLPEGSEVMVIPMGRALGVHAGKGAIGISAVYKWDGEEKLSTGI